MICGPTACGKSELSDFAADLLSERYSYYSPVIVVDSMQVYKELPTVTNQRRRRRAELTGIVSVTEEWTMARNREACDEITGRTKGPFVLDAGTGMYLNALLLDMPIAPRVPKDVRQQAQVLSTEESNPRRASRKAELEMSGAKPRGSIWDAPLRYETELLYIRPDREELDSAISERSSIIAYEGLEEVANLIESFPDGIPNHSVRDSIGVRELTEYLKGQITFKEVERQILTRTRQLSRRQIRWFDKLTRAISGRAGILISYDRRTSEIAIYDYANRG